MNMKKFLLIYFFVFSSYTYSEEYQYEIDQSHFALGFLVEHAGYAKTLGMFRDISGSFVHDESNNKVKNIKIIVQTSSVFTNHEKRDAHLRSPDFLNSDEYPEMIFTADEIKIQNKNASVDGNLTLLGITKPIKLEAKINKIAEYPFRSGLSKPMVMGVSARGSFKRSDFGMMYAIKKDLVGDNIDLIIEFEARRN
ncbi:MAG: hypothetical protein CMD88_03835 [Gammaproteobacteria bacterium]|nr:hypothetical protein [Gammaproteobacteria bacterium]|tara:strand:- start:182513 stop:183100 length:588 start_codon:yes stop_codon:yes gene_type:complete